MKKNRVLILGGGFGGIYAALEFERRREPDFDVTLVSHDNFFLFTPMLHEVAAGDLDLTHIVNPIRKMLRHVRFFEGEVLSVDILRRQVTVIHGFDQHTHALDYDHLVLALGSVTNFYDIPNLAETATQMKTLGDAIGLRNRLIEHLEEAATECAAKDREPLLTFVVAGGGFAGVETIGSINDFFKAALPYYPTISSEMRANTKITAVTPSAVELSEGSQIAARAVVWTAGTCPPPLLHELDLPKERQRLRVNQTLEVDDHPNIWALGDCAMIPDQHGGFQPPTAQHASREGKVLAHNIVARSRGEKLTSFRFNTLGLLASIGRRTGVARVFGVNFSGFPAWWLWRTIYLLKLPRIEKKVRVAMDWTLDLFFSRDFVQYLHNRPSGAVSIPSEHIEGIPSRRCP
jgi:NADH:ubiquinone reductase (H+-translocating)